MTIRQTIVRRRLAVLIACSLIATILPLSATAEYGIPAGSGAVITAGQPLLVRVSPGWDADVSYEIADGSYVTVWNAEQVAPDGTLWYPVDGGFVPADAVSSVATIDGGLALYQDAAPEAVAAEWVDPNAASQGWVDPSTGEWVDPNAVEMVAEAPAVEWVDPNAATQGWIDPSTGEWVDPNAASQGWVEPTTGEWVDSNAATQGWIDPSTGEWVDPNAASQGWVDPVTGEWVDPNAAPGWTDPQTGEWIAQEAVVDPNAGGEGWIDPQTGEWVEPPGKTDGWVENVSDEWVEPAPVEWVESAAEEWVEPAPVESGNIGGAESWGEPIAVAYIAGTSGDGAACRASPERGTDKLAILSEGETVEVRGEAVGEWQPVNCAGIGGYVHTSLISWEPVAAENDGRRNRGANAGNDGTSNSSGSGSGSGGMVGFAMQYVGYPYAYAGEGPYAFDCSGFTKFVAQNALGMDITHDMFTQIEMGQSVGRNELQPGDLVFFANTFRPGLSHVGIYAGDGQFVHAENESTGVKVSDLNSDYYGSRWAGATRLA